MRIPRFIFMAVAVFLMLAAVVLAADESEPKRLPPVTDEVQPVSAPAEDVTAQAEGARVEPVVEEIKPGVLSGAADLSWYEWVLPTHWHVPAPWESSFELGMDGSKGDSDTLTLRGGANLKRKVDWSNLRMDMAYVRGSTFSEQTKHNAKLDVNHDWLFKDSRWTAFGKMWLVYNEFTDYHARLTLNTGAGYLFIDNGQVKLKGQVGGGTSRRFRGLDRRWVPEAVMGMEYDHKLNDRQKLHAEVNYLPVWSDFNDYRVRTEASWEVLLDKKTNMSLKFRVTDRYEGSSNPSSPNILHYSMLLLWKI